MTTTEPVQPELSSHYSLKEGDIDLELNKRIAEVILCTENFIVYLDDDKYIQWKTTDSHKACEHFGEVLNLVSLLEARSRFVDNSEILHSIRRQIAEGLARCLDGQKKDYSMNIFQEVEKEIKARNKETSWRWYFNTAYWITLICVVLFVGFWLSREAIISIAGRYAFEIILGVFCGAIGALLSVTSRGNKLTLDANAGKRLHEMEGVSRIVAGLIGAFFVALGIKGGIIMGGVSFSGNPLSFLLALCLLAGVSERFVPSLIAKLEKSSLK